MITEPPTPSISDRTHYQYNKSSPNEGVERPIPAQPGVRGLGVSPSFDSGVKRSVLYGICAAFIFALVINKSAWSNEVVTLEEQISQLSEIGISLSEGVTLEDLLISYPREEYESSPYDLILFVYGVEVEEPPWGRYICDRAWNFDVEAIEDNGSYVEIVNQFHRITGRAAQIENLSDQVDIEAGVASLSYIVDGTSRSLEPKVEDDWADPTTVDTIMKDLSSPGFSFYAKDNGQASIWFYLSEQEAKALNELANNVFGLNRKPWWKIW